MKNSEALRATGMSPAVVIVALSLLLGLQPVATDLYLPALPQMQQALRITQADAQWTLSIIVLAFGVSQLAWGPVSDRWGRRPVLLWGLGLLTLGSGLSVVAPDLGVMLGARALQGVGLAASVVCGRSMVRDLFEPVQGAAVLSRGLTGLGVIALVGPLVGGVVAAVWGWRATLAVVGLFALACLAYVAMALRETLPTARRQVGQGWGQRVTQWRSIARHPMFRAYTALTSSTYCGLYVFLAASSFVFIDMLHVSRPMFGALMASMSLCYLGGTVLCRRRLPAHGLPGTVRLAAWLSAAAGAWLIALSASSLATGWLPAAGWLLPGLWLYAVAHGIHQPCSQAGVAAPFPQQAGAASALSGFVMSVLAFGVAAVLSAWMKHPAWTGTIHPMLIGCGLGALLTAFIALGRVQRDGHPPGASGTFTASPGPST